MSKVVELKPELHVLEAFRDSGRAQILKSMLEYELKKEEFSHERGTRGSFRS